MEVLILSNTLFRNIINDLRVRALNAGIPAVKDGRSEYR